MEHHSAGFIIMSGRILKFEPSHLDLTIAVLLATLKPYGLVYK